jgi:hypothetical protein
MNTHELLPQASGSVSQLLAAATGCLRLIKHGRPLRLIGLSIVLLGLPGSTTALHAASNAPGLAGTWLTEVAFNGATCSPGDIVQYSCSLALVTFHSDGTLAEVDTFAPPSRQSWGAGVWQADGPNSFAATFQQLQFDRAGHPIYYDVVWGPLTLSEDGQTFSQSGSFASYNFDGTPITTPGYSGTFTATGTRMQVRH